MDFIKKIFNRQNNKNFDNDSMYRTLGGYGRQPSDYFSVEQQLRSYLGWVYACAKILSSDVSRLKIELYQNTTNRPTRKVFDEVLNTKQIDGANRIENHPFIDLLYNPNAFTTKRNLFQTTQLHLDLTGNCFWHLIGVGDIPQEIWILRPERVRVMKSNTDFISGYEYTNENGNRIRIPTEAIVHFKESNPFDPYLGQGVVRAAAASIATDTDASTYNRTFLKNSAIPSQIFTTEKQISKEALAHMQQQLRERQGVDNAGKPMILEDGIKPEAMSLSQRDMEYLEGRKYTRDEILALFNVSGAILGIQESSNRATAEAADYTFAKRSIAGRMELIVDTLSHQLLPFFGDNLLLGFDDPVPSDKDYVLKEKAQSVNVWRTPNEIREMEGRPPLPGGDMLLGRINTVPLEVLEEAELPTQDSTEDGTEDTE